MRKICVIGNGVAGITAARHIRKLKNAADYQITVISSETDHFYSRTALMYIYMGHMTYEHTKPYEDIFWPKNHIQLIRDYVISVDTQSKALQLQKQGPLSYDILILATGSKGKEGRWPGESLKGVQGMITLQDVEALEINTQQVSQGVIVGGGLIGVEMAECLHSRHIPVTILLREDAYWQSVLPKEEAEMVSRHLINYGIKLKTQSGLKEIHGDSAGHVQSVTTVDGEEITCQFVGTTIGVKPNIGFLKDSPIETDRGVLVNEFLETNISDVYAVGDCAQHRIAPAGRKDIEQIWYSARMQGETVAQTIAGKKTRYVPGVFFNSAKFFDIEYQVYGTINSTPADDEEQFYWEHEQGEKSVRIAFDKQNGIVRGFNLMGIRYKHAVCDHWIKEKKDIQYVMSHLSEANFDPEFFKQYEHQMIHSFNEQYPELSVALKKKKGLLFGFFGK